MNFCTENSFGANAVSSAPVTNAEVSYTAAVTVGNQVCDPLCVH